MTKMDEVNKLLSKGLTGKEAGRLVLQDNWQADHGKETFLSQKDINTLKRGLKTTQDIKDYNSYIRTYELLDYTLRQANIAKLEAEKLILLLDHYLLMTLNRLMEDHDNALFKPSIMTEKQYQDVKANQRARLLASLHDLEDVILWRVEEKYPGYLEPLEEGGEYMVEANLEYLAEEEPDKLRGAILDILQLLKTDQIQPASFSEKYKKQLKDLKAERDVIYEASHISQEDDPKTRVLTKEEKASLDRIFQDEDQLKLEAYKAGRRDQEKLISTLEGLLDGSIKPDKAEAILKAFYTTGEELYKTGLPEQVSWIDEFKPALHKGEGTLSGIAVIQDPKDSMLDERGYYYKSSYADDWMPSKGSGMADTYQQGHKQIIESIKLFLAFHSIVEAVSEVIGIDFAEETRGWLDSLSSIIDSHNQTVEQARYYALSEILGYEIKPIKLDRYKPSAQTVKYLRERMSISLGDGWYEAKEALSADLDQKEALDD
jgi:hypothetical protein